MQFLLYLASYSPYIVMFLFMTATLGVLFISVLSKSEGRIIDISFVLSSLYEPFVISIFLFLFVAQLITTFLYWRDIKRTEISEQDIKKWKRFFLRPNTLALMYYYDFKYPKKGDVYPLESLFKTTRDRMVEFVAIELPSEVQKIKSQQNNNGYKGMAFYAFVISTAVIVSSIILGIFW